MKEKTTQLWIPLYIDKWIFGSTRIELEPDERGVFVDLLALAAKDQGFIRANETTPYPHQQLAGLLNIPIELLDSALVKCLHFEKLIEPIPGIYKLKNWDEYQLSEDYKYRLSTGRKLIPGSPVRKNPDYSPGKPGPIRKDRIGEDKRRKDTYTAPDKPGAECAYVNWDNYRTDLQKLIAHYVHLEMPALYTECTQKQATGIFKRYGRAASDILNIAGSIEIATAAFDSARAHFISEKLAWNLSTVAKNAGEFVNEIIGEKNK